MGLALFGMQTEADLMIEATQLDEFTADMKLYLKTLLTACAYAGSGNVTKVQEMQHIIAKNKDEVNPKVQSIAVISVSLIALGEEVGTEMVLRAFNHFIQYGDNNVKRAVPLAMALIK
jgi:26S proteasome regulatory subunit N1